MVLDNKEVEDTVSVPDALPLLSSSIQPETVVPLQVVNSIIPVQVRLELTVMLKLVGAIAPVVKEYKYASSAVR